MDGGLMDCPFVWSKGRVGERVGGRKTTDPLLPLFYAFIFLSR